MDAMRSISVPLFRGELLIVGGVGQGLRGLGHFLTVGTANRIVDWIYNGYGAEIMNLQHQWDFSVLGYDMQCGGDEARPQ